MKKNIILSAVALVVLTGSSFAMGGFGSMMQQGQNMVNSNMNQAQQQVV